MAAPAPPPLRRINSPPPGTTEAKEQARLNFNAALVAYRHEQTILIRPNVHRGDNILTPAQIQQLNPNLTPEQQNNITNLYNILTGLQNTWTNTQSKYNKYYLKYLKYKEKYLALKKLL
jgi:hypothetical protein